MRILASTFLVLSFVASVAVPVNAAGSDPVSIRAERLVLLDVALDSAQSRLDIAVRDRETALSHGIPSFVSSLISVVGISVDDIELDERSIELIAPVAPDLSDALLRERSARRQLANIRSERSVVEHRLITSMTTSEFVSPHGNDVERWRLLVGAHFAPADVDDALAVMECESQGDPNARNSRSSARGLFQFLRGTWKVASAGAGVDHLPSTHPEASIAAAAWLTDLSRSSGQDAWHHWSCKP